MPKKVMFNTAMLAEQLHDHPDYGFNSKLEKFDWRYVEVIDLRLCNTRWPVTLQ